MKTQLFKIYGIYKSSSKREVYSNIGLPQEIRNISNKQSNLTFKWIRIRNTNKQSPKSAGGNIREEINKIETKKQ